MKNNKNKEGYLKTSLIEHILMFLVIFTMGLYINYSDIVLWDAMLILGVGSQLISSWSLIKEWTAKMIGKKFMAKYKLFSWISFAIGLILSIIGTIFAYKDMIEVLILIIFISLFVLLLNIAIIDMIKRVSLNKPE